MKSIKDLWGQLGAKLGIVFCLGGFVALFLGWNGAASYDRVPAQFPYLISGGLVGLSLVVIGAAMIVGDGQRRGTDELRAELVELRQAIEAMGSSAGNGHRPALSSGMVVAGASSYHRPECHLVDGRDTTRILAIDEAESEGLTACRICKPEATRRTPLKAR